jgi:hypothetical protein
LLTRGGAGLNQILVKQVLKLRAPGLEAGGVGVRDVVRDVVHI